MSALLDESLSNGEMKPENRISRQQPLCSRQRLPSRALAFNLGAERVALPSCDLTFQLALLHGVRDHLSVCRLTALMLPVSDRENLQLVLSSQY